MGRMTPRRATRRDDNEPAIVEALEAVGAKVIQGQPPLPDLVVGYRNRTYLLGVKAPDGPRGGTSHGRDRKNRPSDHKPDDWRGGPWLIVTTPFEALVAVGAKYVCRCGVFEVSAARPVWIDQAERNHSLERCDGSAPVEATSAADIECGDT